jgi:hypothetical protein
MCGHEQVAGMAPQAVLDRMQSMAPMRPTETMAQQALGGQQGGTYLAPALYRPVVQVNSHCHIETAQPVTTRVHCYAA